MKKCYGVLPALLLILIAGCSLMRMGQKQDVVGTWTGNGYLINMGVSKTWNMTMVFNEDLTYSLIYESNGKKSSFKGKYILDMTKRPATIDIVDFGFTTSKLTYSFRALAEFPKKDRMNFYGVMGKVGEVEFPTKFLHRPTNHYEICCELTKQKTADAAK